MYSRTDKISIAAFCIAIHLWISMVSSVSYAVSPTPAMTPVVQPTTSAPTSSKEEISCKKVFERYAIPYQNLWSKRSLELRDEHTDGLSLIAEMTPNHCSDESTRKELFGVLSRLLNGHTSKASILLPISTKPYSQHLSKGMEAATKNAGLDPSKVLVVMDTQSKIQRTEQLIAQAVFQHRVTAIVGGFESADTDTLRNWGIRLALPTFIINKPPTNQKPAPFIYYNHPTPRGIAQAMLAANQRYLHRKVSIMRPNDQHVDDVVKEYEALANSAGITVVHNVVYDPRRIDQMEAAARKLFKLEPNDRLDELKQLYEKAKDHAAQTKTTFNAKMVALQPMISQDAIMILDQFKTVRHMAKIFSYLGVRRIPMFGHYEWRSSGLIDPFDPMFVGSYFIDVSGTYERLPAGLDIPASAFSSPYFATPDRVEEVDFNLLGYRAMGPVVSLLKTKNVARRKLDPVIRKGDGTKATEYDANHVLDWPAFLFEITSSGNKGSLILKGQP